MSVGTRSCTLFMYTTLVASLIAWQFIPPIADLFMGDVLKLISVLRTGLWIPDVLRLTPCLEDDRKRGDERPRMTERGR